MENCVEIIIPKHYKIPKEFVESSAVNGKRHFMFRMAVGLVNHVILKIDLKCVSRTFPLAVAVAVAGCCCCCCCCWRSLMPVSGPWRFHFVAAQVPGFLARYNFGSAVVGVHLARYV